MKSVLFCLVFLTFSLAAISQNQTGLEWLSIQEASKRNAKVPKKIFIDIYTNWCGWCKKMDATTFENPDIVAYMNKNYYSVKLNAEIQDTIMFEGKPFVFRPEMKKHELAMAFLNNDVKGYPSCAILDEKLAVITNHAGYLTAPQIEPLLKFFGDDKYKTENWADYQKNFQGTVK